MRKKGRSLRAVGDNSQNYQQATHGPEPHLVGAASGSVSVILGLLPELSTG